MFAIGAVVTFIEVGCWSPGTGASASAGRAKPWVLISGPVDLLAAIGAAAALAPVPGLLAWPFTGIGTTATFRLVGGVDLLIARRTAAEQD